MIFVLLIGVGWVLLARYVSAENRERTRVDPVEVARDDSGRSTSRDNGPPRPVLTKDQTLWTAWDQHQLNRMLDQSSP
jgi:hypothetical protein